MNDQDPDRAQDRDDIGTLIRLAEQDSKIPTARAARVGEAAHEQWTQEIERRRRRRRVGSVLAAAAMIAGVAFLIRAIPGSGSNGATTITAHIEQLEGRVETAALGGDAWSVVAAGDTINAVTTVRTMTGRLSLRLDSGHCVRLDRDSELRFLDEGGLELVAGTIYIDSGPQGKIAGIDLHTPYGIVQEIGTQYEARMSDGVLRLRLREGSVILRRPDGDHTVDAGNELRVSSTRDPEIVPIEAFGPRWDWVSEIAPIPDFQGRTADEFLRWLAREKGWTLAFADNDVANAARQTVLEGDLRRFSPDEALQIVTTTSRLRYTTEAGVLRVTAER